LSEKNIKLEIQYDGTEFAGWQYQPDERTVQNEIEKAIANVAGRTVKLYGAGRTDAGVHALGQVANFKIEHRLSPERFSEAINFYLPKTIYIKKSWLVPDDFNARKSAKSRHYRYIIGLERSALYFKYRWEYGFHLDINRMNRMANIILGWHDFSSLCTVSSLKENNECYIISAEWTKDNEALYFDIRANRFLHSMVRSLVGLMTEGGRQKDYLTLENFQNIIKSGDHTKIRMIAPAKGLYLVDIEY